MLPAAWVRALAVDCWGWCYSAVARPHRSGDAWLPAFVNVLVTGGSGLVGGAVLRALLARRFTRVVGAVRRDDTRLPEGVERIVVGELSGQTDWRGALQGVEAVLHAAARVHVMQDQATDPLAAFRRVNVDGTLELARQAARAGVRRFVFVSSVKVNGEASPPGRPYRVDDPPAPADTYALSKYEAELGLRHLAAQTGMELVVVRSPLVYGPGARGNFHRLVQLARWAVPLPLGAIDNRRSLIGIDNLVDFLLVCLTHPAAADGVFLVSDGQDVSTAQLYRRLAAAHGKTARLPAVSPRLLRTAANLLGRRATWQRLCGSLQVDAGLARERLGWRAPLRLDEGLQRAVRSTPREAV